jgi:hypothetical protein
VDEGVSGIRLAEGDPIKAYPVSQEGLEEYAEHWREVAAQVTDASGREWISKRPRKKKVPSWATPL